MSEKREAITDLAKEIKKQLPEIKAETAKFMESLLKNSPRIMICGPTGVGKSSLINKVFRENLATTGVGKPVSTHIKLYKKRDVPVQIYDTPGFEIGNEDCFEEIMNFIEKKKGESDDPGKHILALWYCISGPGARIQPSEIKFLKSVSKQIPVIVLLTKTDQDEKETNKLLRSVRSLNLDIATTLPVSVKSSGLNLKNVISVTLDVVPEQFHESLVNAQMVSIEAKEEQATKYLYGYASGAAIAGFSPIPFSSWILIVPIQLTMMIHIGAIFGIEIKKNLLKPIAAYVVGTGGATLAGKFLANLAKFIPGLNIFGGIIDAAIATSITTALGTAYIGILSKSIRGSIEDDEMSQKEIVKLLEKEIKNAKRRAKKKK